MYKGARCIFTGNIKSFNVTGWVGGTNSRDISSDNATDSSGTCLVPMILTGSHELMTPGA